MLGGLPPDAAELLIELRGKKLEPERGEVWRAPEDVVRDLKWSKCEEKDRPCLVVGFRGQPGHEPIAVLVEGTTKWKPAERRDHRYAERHRLDFVVAPEEVRGLDKPTHFLLIWDRDHEVEGGRVAEEFDRLGAIREERLTELKEVVKRCRSRLVRTNWRTYSQATRFKRRKR